MINVKIPFKRGTAAQNDAYRGSNGEITIDSENSTLRVHDGVKSGGEKLLTESSLEDFLQATINMDRRFEVVNKGVIYRAEAAPGTAENSPEWRIRRLTVNYDTKVVTRTWANNDSGFVHKWSDRATYSYTL